MVSELTKSQCEEYSEKGYLFLHSVFGDTCLAELLDEAESLIDHVGPLEKENPRMG